MTAAKLTNRAACAHNAPMSGGRRAAVAVTAMVGCGLLAGCISVNAPSKPIEIDLNINVKQEVIYRLTPDAKNTIDENANIF